MDKKYIVLIKKEGSLDESTYKEYDSLAQAYKTCVQDPARRNVYKLVNVKIVEGSDGD